MQASNQMAKFENILISEYTELQIRIVIRIWTYPNFDILEYFIILLFSQQN